MYWCIWYRRPAAESRTVQTRAQGECRAYTNSLQNEQFCLPTLYILQYSIGVGISINWIIVQVCRNNLHLWRNFLNKLLKYITGNFNVKFQYQLYCTVYSSSARMRRVLYAVSSLRTVITSFAHNSYRKLIVVQ